MIIVAWEVLRSSFAIKLDYSRLGLVSIFMKSVQHNEKKRRFSKNFFKNKIFISIFFLLIIDTNVDEINWINSIDGPSVEVNNRQIIDE